MENTKSASYRDAISAVLTAVVGVFVVFYGRGLPGDSGLFPILVGILMLVGSIGLLLTSICRIQRMEKNSDSEITALSWPSCKQGLVAAGGLTIYTLVLMPLGFFTATALLLVLLPLALGYRSLLAVIINSLVVLACLYLVFIGLFERPLPTEFFLR